MEILILPLILFLLVALAIALIVIAVKAINYYPSVELKIELTNKPKMSSDDLLDYYIINFGIEQITNHINEIRNWKQSKLEACKGREKKIAKLKARCAKNQHKAFHFVGYRINTRYRQVNYQRYPYKVAVVSNEFSIDDHFVVNRIRFLKKHDYDVTYNQYTKTDQRKALTQKLKDKIKERDNYTCYECGKHMPDEVGLQIDHIIPVSKGGKSTPSNLRVLCSKCNGRKGGK